MESVHFLLHSDIPRLMPQTKWKYQYRNIRRNLFFKVDSDGLETDDFEGDRSFAKLGHWSGTTLVETAAWLYLLHGLLLTVAKIKCCMKNEITFS